MISETGMSRDARKVISGNHVKIYTFSRAVTEVRPYAFNYIHTLQSVRPNEGLETLGPYAFSTSGIRSFTAPSSLKHIETHTFLYCTNLKHADFSASMLRPEDGYNYFSPRAFMGSGLESVVFPRTLRIIEAKLF